MTLFSRVGPTLTRLVGERRAIVDTAAGAPSPLQPIDLTDDASVAEVLDLAIRVGEVNLASGTGAIDTVEQIKFVASTYGLNRCYVDVTYNSITISAYRGPTLPPASTMRVVQYRSMDFTRLADVDALARRIRTQVPTPKTASAELKAIVDAPHPYNRWIATLAWSGMAAAIAVLVGGGLLVALVSFLTTMVIDRVGRVLNRAGLPFFFQQVVGGLIASAPALTLYNFEEELGIQISPTQVIAAGVTVLLSGLSLVGSVQDAITGAPITAAARFFELLMMTGGIIAGVAMTLRVADLVGAELPILSVVAPQDFAQVPTKVLAGAAAAFFYALASYAERRALTAAFVSGFAGALVFLLTQQVGLGPVLAAAVAATVVGFAGGLMARRALIPPLIVAVAGITPLLPGLSVYRGLFALLTNQTLVGIGSLLAALGTGAALAGGVTLGEWGARTLRKPRIIQRTESLVRPIFTRRATSNSVRFKRKGWR